MAAERPSGEFGQILISAGVIEQLVIEVIAEQDELLPLNYAEGGLARTFPAPLTGGYKGSGIEVTREGEELKVRLQMIARYGISIPAAARRLIWQLRQRLSELAGLDVVVVELEVNGLKLPTRTAPTLW